MCVYADYERSMQGTLEAYDAERPALGPQVDVVELMMTIELDDTD